MSADDEVRLEALTGLLEAARRSDDPDAFPITVRELGNDLRYGHDLEPPVVYALEPDRPGEPVAMMNLDIPERDNRHLIWADITVHPDCRGRGYGSQLMDALVEMARDLGRTTLWAGAPEDPVWHGFLTRRGFARASGDARRHQVLAEVDWAEIARLEVEAAERSADYTLERLTPPYDDTLLKELIEVTAAINDAPMGSLDFEEEVFDLERVRNGETAWQRRGDRVFRVVARHRGTDEIGGHTFLVHDLEQPTLGRQGDTAVSRGHRGHRLGLACKIEMLRWLAEAEPRIEVIETWNNVDNRFMISVNEAMGYRLSRTFATYQRVLA